MPRKNIERPVLSAKIIKLKNCKSKWIALLFIVIFSDFFIISIFQKEEKTGGNVFIHINET